ncbi:Cu(I)-responsive transcriptional regulator [Aestuariispira insulae]|uniref:Cu(I)-responsive transcriptional regulator n=1 Tax=Aestuariispira insulae TaxID=1461337 RepID=A0A3D9HXC3_9PROT|nr:Cu(I)-responsive transcriptional regulator [Aestuariispira insulae]RED54065.1 Cu(I)-responsive transcriptional regulator [Aestuariispira insulae]
MNIGTAASKSGMSAKTIRYYEDIGLIAPANRRESGYRDYSEDDVHLLQFLHRARSLGFSVKQCRELLSLYKDRNRASGDVKAIALGHVHEISEKIKELQAMKDTLETLVDKCHGDERPNCPILKDLAGSEPNNK